MADDDGPVTLPQVAAMALANRKFLIMMASLLVGAGAVTLDDLQDCLLDQAAKERQPDQPDAEFGALIGAELEALAKLFDSSVLPLRPPEQPRRRPEPE
jgi:hypothetical protein